MKLKEGMVINCRTKGKASKFLRECYKQGIFIGSGRPIGEVIDDWSDFKQDTCYSIKLNFNNKKIIRFSSTKYYLDRGFKVIDFDDLFKEEKKMSKCKVYEMPDYVGNEVKKVIINDRTVVVILKSGHKGIATCSPEDKFIESVGYQIALIRARINKSKDNLKEKEETLNRIIENPRLIAEFSIV